MARLRRDEVCHTIPSLADEHEEFTADRIFPHRVLHQGAQPV